MAEQLEPTNVNAILKELSDIKANLAVNSAETSNIKSSISEIKVDIKEIKNDYVIRREFDDAIREVKDSIAPLKKFVFALGLAVVGAILQQVLK